jgi:acetyl esterase/lipase
MKAQSIQPSDLWKQQVVDADRRVAYGVDALQFSELRLPKTNGPHPVVVLVHGGCFVDRLPGRDPRDTTFEPLRPLAAALADAGVATWNLEYRRAGNPGGGYPGSFQDLGAGMDFLRSISRANSLDLDRVVLVGHSAGGPLVQLLAARPKLPPSNPLYAKNPVRAKAIVNVDGPPDIAASQPLEMKFCPVPGISRFMGGSVVDQPDRYRDTSALLLLPIGVRQTIVVGGLLRSYDLVSSYEAAAVAKGDSISVVQLDGGGHFDMLSPASPYGKSLIKAILTALK